MGRRLDASLRRTTYSTGRALTQRKNPQCHKERKPPPPRQPLTSIGCSFVQNHFCVYTNTIESDFGFYLRICVHFSSPHCPSSTQAESQLWESWPQRRFVAEVKSRTPPPRFSWLLPQKIEAHRRM